MNFISSERIDYWLERLEPFKKTLLDVAAEHGWPDPEDIKAAFDRAYGRLEEDIKTLETQIAFVFVPAKNPDRATDQAVETLKVWHLSARPPSLAALSIMAIENFGTAMRPDDLNAVLMAGFLGEVDNRPAYHNNMHFRKVLLQALRLIAAHNDIYTDTPKAFTARQITLLLVAACVHDIGHDGQGNTLRGHYEQGRLEQRSFELAVPFLQKAGLEREELDKLRVMILSTEATPLGDPVNFMNQMKAAYRYHYLGEKGRVYALNLDPQLQALQDNPDLAMMSLILHEADIATSAGLTYEVTKYETSLYMQEVKGKAARPHHVLNFFKQVCGRKMLSDAGQMLYAGNMARIYALARQDEQAGDEPFSHPEQSGFLTHIPDGLRDERPDDFH